MSALFVFLEHFFTSLSAFRSQLSWLDRTRLSHVDVSFRDLRIVNNHHRSPSAEKKKWVENWERVICVFSLSSATKIARSSIGWFITPFLRPLHTVGCYLHVRFSPILMLTKSRGKKQASSCPSCSVASRIRYIYIDVVKRSIVFLLSYRLISKE